MFEKKEVKDLILCHISPSHISSGEAKLNYVSFLINSCHDRGLPSHKQRLMVTYVILVILIFNISQSNYIFIKICMNLDILSKSGT